MVSLKVLFGLWNEIILFQSTYQHIILKSNILERLIFGTKLHINALEEFYDIEKYYLLCIHIALLHHNMEFSYKSVIGEI